MIRRTPDPDGPYEPPQRESPPDPPCSTSTEKGRTNDHAYHLAGIRSLLIPPRFRSLPRDLASASL